nr:hypothetical protein [Tanacetum cinerariifolium]
VVALDHAGDVGAQQSGGVVAVVDLRDGAGQGASQFFAGDVAGCTHQGYLVVAAVVAVVDRPVIRGQGTVARILAIERLGGAGVVAGNQAADGHRALGAGGAVIDLAV